MKGRITTVLSLTGVLAAGSAAALVNTQVLQSTESKSAGEVVVGSTDAPNATTVATKIEASVLSSTQAMYQIGDAGLVTLDSAGNVLTVVSVAPNSGWIVVKAENNGSGEIEVKLQNGSTLVEFKANLQHGVITTSVESSIVASDGSGGTTSGSGSTSVNGTVADHVDDGVDATIDVEIHNDDNIGLTDDDD